MARAIFFCGLACAGKSTLARALESALPAARYSVDEFMRRSHDLTVFDDEFGIQAREARAWCWEKGRLDLAAGNHVLFDWSLWSRARRAAWTSRFTDDGHSALILFLDVPLPTLVSRLEARNANLPDSAHNIPVAELERFAGIFEPPSENEGHTILSVSPTDSLEVILRRIEESA